MAFDLTPSSNDGLRSLGLSLSRMGNELSPGKARTQVLVVDDEPHVRSITARMLLEGGYDVLEAGSGEQALTLLQDNPSIRLALVDLVMPQMDGVTLAARIRQGAGTCRLIFMTGFSVQQSGVIKSFPDTCLLRKPFTHDQLLTQVALTLQDTCH